MNYYETLYIIHPALDGGRIKEMVLSVNKTLEKAGGSPKAVDVWGKKKLAYEIDKQKYGTYVLVQFTGDGLGNSKFNMELEHNPNILGYLTLRIEEEKLKDQTLSIDDQIRGDYHTSSSSNNTEKSSNKDSVSDADTSSDSDVDEDASSDSETTSDNQSEEKSEE